MANPLLRRPLRPEDIKPRLLGHWGTTPGLNLLYAHLNRVIRHWDLDMIFIAGPGHGGPGLVANAYLEGTYTERYPNITRDAAGLAALMRQFSFPGGIGSHATPEVPGSIHEGGELGYSLAHAYGAVFDNPDLIAACVVGDGEAETGPLATSWHSNKFLNPATDGAVLPILHLNGYKIANPTVLARIPDGELTALLEGYGYRVHVVAGDEPEPVHRQLAATLDEVVEEIQVHPAPRPGRTATSPGPAGRRSCWRRRRGGPARRPWTACRWRGRSGRTRCRSPMSAPTPRTWPSWRNGCAATGPMSCSTPTARWSDELAALAPHATAG